MRANSRREIVTFAALVIAGLSGDGQCKPNISATAGREITGGISSVGNAASDSLSRTSNADASHPFGYHVEAILEKVKANDDQRQKIIAVVQSYKVKIQPLRDEYRQKRQEFIVLMTSGSTAETIMSKQVELSHLHSEITASYTLMRLEIRRMLTPQQILLFEEYVRQQGWNSH